MHAGLTIIDNHKKRTETNSFWFMSVNILVEHIRASCAQSKKQIERRCLSLSLDLSAQLACTVVPLPFNSRHKTPPTVHDGRPGVWCVSCLSFCKRFARPFKLRQKARTATQQRQHGVVPVSAIKFHMWFMASTKSRNFKCDI